VYGSLATNWWWEQTEFCTNKSCMVV